eukprot:CCRYP_018654-RA/>CCRYP_018654-RA protein AED:0.02 eAED:0.02 QI:0/-1/0/1/-1/0/1/0/490
MGCRWAPDGTCILTATAADGKFRLYDTPFHRLGSASANDDVNSADCDERVDTSETNVSAANPNSSQNAEEGIERAVTYSHNENYHTPALPDSKHAWNASLTSHQGGPPPPSASASYSFYPLFNSSSPLTSLYATCRGHSLPIHLIDAYTSELRASYRPFNNVDELEGPTVVEFSPDGSRIYGTGFKSDRTIAVFDTAIPGRECQILRLGKTRRSADGQKGIPSAIAFPKCSGENGPSNVFAVGTYSPASIYIYDDRMATSSGPAGTVVLHGGLTVVGHGRAFARKKRRFVSVTDGSHENEEPEENWFSSARVNWFQSQARGGITQLMWAPPLSSNPYVLYSASRRSNAVLSWDVRMLSALGSNENGSRSGGKQCHPVCGLQSFARDGNTNQRLDFDVDEYGEKIFMGTGRSDGVVKFYNRSNATVGGEIKLNLEDEKSPLRDAVNGVSFMTICNRSVLAVAVGSRRYEDQPDCENSVPMKTGLLQLYILD